MRSGDGWHKSDTTASPEAQAAGPLQAAGLCESKDSLGNFAKPCLKREDFRKGGYVWRDKCFEGQEFDPRDLKHSSTVASPNPCAEGHS